jgi:hypothetical protein
MVGPGPSVTPGGDVAPDGLERASESAGELAVSVEGDVYQPDPPVLDEVRFRLAIRWLVRIVVAGLVVGLAWGFYNYGRNSEWWGLSDSERWLEKQPMADKHLLGLKLVETRRQDNVGFGEWLPPPQFLVRVFSTDGRDQQEVINEIVEYALSIGCEREDGSLTYLTCPTDEPYDLMIEVSTWARVSAANYEELVGRVAVSLRT